MRAEVLLSRTASKNRRTGAWLAWILLPVLTSCFYVTKEEYRQAWDRDGDGFPNDEDCAPDDARIFPGAGDRRGDFCDADCGVEADADGDDWPDTSDCYDSDDPTIYPCAPDIAGDGIDSDCDGFDEPRPPGDTCPGVDARDPDAVMIPLSECFVPVAGAPQ